MGSRGWWFVVICLWVLVLISALNLVHIRHQVRLQFIQLQKLVKERDQLATEWTQLQIEQSALANHARIDRLARGRLGLRQPTNEDVVIISKKKRIYED